MAEHQRDHVFISYSHQNPTWRDRLLPFLKPWVRAGQLEVWADTYIEVGGRWRREIATALVRTRVGVLLISQDFLASDFIVEEELPALLGAADDGLARLICVPVSSANLQAPLPEARLLDFQWPRAPGSPLDLLTEAQQQEALTRIAEAIVEAAGINGNGRPESGADLAVARRELQPVRRPEAGSAMGELHDVPEQRPNYVERRGDLDRIKTALTAGGNPTVGITGVAQRVGLHGRGGIGKSVLAIAVANDEQVRRAFPDGIYWLTVGQQPKLTALQVNLARALGEPNPVVADVSEGRSLLRRLWGDRNALLILDDVWVLDHARLLEVTSPASRVLITTRDGTVVTALDAHEESIDTLSESDALRLLASWAGREAGSLPALAVPVAVECGYLPLALSVAGALVRDGSSWGDLVSALRAGKVRFLEHPSGSVFASMRLSVDFLAVDLRERFLELAVFPEDEDVPEETVCHLWARTAQLEDFESRRFLNDLARKGLLYLDRTDTDHGFVSFHDLQHDFLRVVAEDVKGLHVKLVEAYLGNDTGGFMGADR